MLGTDLVLDRYRLGERLGAGGMGVLFAAVDVQTGGQVAVKVMRPGAFQDGELKRRFARELMAARSLAHPHIVRCLDAGETDTGAPVLVLERLYGATLQAVLSARAPLGLAETLAHVLPIIAALIHAHARGVVHRDLSPDNVFLSRTGEGGLRPVLLDFGIAAVSQASRMTATGTLVGTLPYVAPEQILRAEASAQSDVWSVGVLLFHCLAGRHPHAGVPERELLAHIAKTPVPTLVSVAPHVPVRLAAAIDRALHHRLDRRYASMAELDQALRAVASAEGLVPDAALPEGRGDGKEPSAATVALTLPISIGEHEDP